jgi:hypothetical protein
MTETDEELEALREQTDPGTRVGAPAEPSDEFVEDLEDALRNRMATGAQRSIGFWDGEVAALMDAFEEHPKRMEHFGETVREELGVAEEGELDRSEFVRLGVLYAIHECDPKLWNQWRDTVAEYHRGV